MAATARHENRSTNCGGAVPGRAGASAAALGGARIQCEALDADAEGRAFRGDGRAGAARGGRAGVLSRAELVRTAARFSESGTGGACAPLSGILPSARVARFVRMTLGRRFSLPSGTQLNEESSSECYAEAASSNLTRSAYSFSISR